MGPGHKKKPTSTMKNMTTKQTMKQHQDIPRLVRCIANVKVTASEKDMKTTQDTNFVYQKSQ